MFLKIAWAFVVSAGFCYWFLQLIAAIRTLKRVPVLEEVPVHEPPEWPKVSVIMTARNEEKALEKALTARLRDEYPNVEYIIIDDRSTDRTGSIVDEFAAKDRRVMPLHLRELPEGWLGKLYALERGAAEASGDWLLFSDADVHVEQGTLRKAVAYAEGRKIDHLAIHVTPLRSAPPLGACHMIAQLYNRMILVHRVQLSRFMVVCQAENLMQRKIETNVGAPD